MLPDWAISLVDDTAVFPPRNLPLEVAVREHREFLAGAAGPLIASLVVSDVHLADLAHLLDAPLTVNLVVTGGAGALEPALAWAARAEHLEVRAIEIALRDEADLPSNVARIATMRDAVGCESPVYVEMPRIYTAPTAGWLAAADEIAMTAMAIKFRAGAGTPDPFPTPMEFAQCIDAVLDRELPFKCTGTASDGFLNILIGTAIAMDGGRAPDIAAALASTGPALVSAEDLTRARRWFHSVDCTNILEVPDALVT